MEQVRQESLLFSYSDTFYSFLFNNDTQRIHMARNHALSYIYSGEMVLETGNRRTIVRKGECVFIRRDHRVTISKRAAAGEQYKGIFITFNRNMLREIYQKIDKKQLPGNSDRIKQNVVKLNRTPEIESLFSSMVPYFDPAVKPKEELIQLKQMEGVCSLLAINPRFYPTLFDFSEPWKIDILDFLNKNYMYDLSMEDIAIFTGRSLATLKRDFNKISDVPPQKWLIRKRLEIAYDKVKNGNNKIGEVCTDVGFKNLSHFSTAFKKQFGRAPTEV